MTLVTGGPCASWPQMAAHDDEQLLLAQRSFLLWSVLALAFAACFFTSPPPVFKLPESGLFSVFGADDRRPFDVTQKPWRAIGRIELHDVGVLPAKPKG